MSMVVYDFGRRDKSENAWADSVFGPSQGGDLPLDQRDLLFIINNTQSGRQSSLSLKNKLDICLVALLLPTRELTNFTMTFSSKNQQREHTISSSKCKPYAK